MPEEQELELPGLEWSEIWRAIEGAAKRGGTTWLTIKGRHVAAIVPPSCVGQRSTFGRPRVSGATDAEIIHAYTIEKLSLNACAEKLEVNATTVTRALERNNIARRPKGRVPTKK